MFFRSRAKMPPRCPQDASKTPQDTPKKDPRPPQDGTKNGPRRPKTPPKRPKTTRDSPKTAQDGPKTPPRRPKIPQDGSRTSKIVKEYTRMLLSQSQGKSRNFISNYTKESQPKMVPRRPLDAPRPPQDGTKTAPRQDAKVYLSKGGAFNAGGRGRVNPPLELVGLDDWRVLSYEPPSTRPEARGLGGFLL